jgi:hypothetical protein
MICGGIAVGFYAEPRFTKDLDVVVAVDANSENRLLNALRDFGAPTALLDPGDFLREDFVFYFGVPPWRIDILTSIPGVEFDKAYERRSKLLLGDSTVSVLSKDDLIAAKMASGRPQDLLDADALRRSG